MEDVKLTFKDDALTAIAKKAIARKTGARGLRAILEESLLETMFDIPGNKDVKEVVLNKKAIEQKEKPTLILEKDSDKSKSKKDLKDKSSDNKSDKKNSKVS